ncbi:hypothetical protein U1Q18_003600 [Sarracenia purpurea var. burkii]
MLLDDLQYLHLPADHREAAHFQNPGARVALQVRASGEPIGDDIHRHVHPHRPPRLRLSRWPPRLSDHRPPVVKSRGGVAVLERRHVPVLDRHVRRQGHVGARPRRGGAVDELQFVDLDSVHDYDGVFHSEHGEDEDYDDDDLEEEESGGAAAALDAFFLVDFL